MFERQVPVREGGHLALVDMAGDVVIGSWDKAEILIRVQGDPEETLTVEETETGPAIAARASCEVQVPAAVPVVIRQVAGHLQAKGLVGLDAEQVRGNLKLSQVGDAVVAEVYGSLRATETKSLRVVGTVHGEASLKAVPIVDLQNVRGNLQVKASDRLRASRVGGNLQAKEISHTLDVDQVGGNALIKGVGGVLVLDQVAGNLMARNLTGGARVPRIGGNLVLNGELGSGCTYHFKADGNATLRFSKEASAHLTLKAQGRMLSSVALVEQEQDGTTLTGTLGGGGAEIVIEAKGNILVGSAEPTLGADLGAEISRQVEESLGAIDFEAIGRQVSEEMESAMSRLRVKLESVDWERLGLQAQRGVERAMERLQRDMDRMVTRAARQQERWDRQSERAARHEERREARISRKAQREHPSSVDVTLQDWSVEEAAGAVEPEPSLDEERLSILRMVEQGQITPEEAEMLLDALG